MTDDDDDDDSSGEREEWDRLGDVRVWGPEQCPQGRVHRLEASHQKQSWRQQSYSFSGDGGLDELTEDFNPSKIQYAFLKVEDPKTSLPKFVLINWQVRECTILSSVLDKMSLSKLVFKTISPDIRVSCFDICTECQPTPSQIQSVTSCTRVNVLRTRHPPVTF